MQIVLPKHTISNSFYLKFGFACFKFVILRFNLGCPLLHKLSVISGASPVLGQLHRQSSYVTSDSIYALRTTTVQN